jgi:hypothetical protein
MEEGANVERERAAWEAARAKGPLRYVLTRGVLAWGVPMGAFLTLYEYFATGLSFEAHEVAVRCFVFVLGGVLYGAIDWKLTESRYRKSG